MRAVASVAEAKFGCIVGKSTADMRLPAAMTTGAQSLVVYVRSQDLGLAPA